MCCIRLAELGNLNLDAALTLRNIQYTGEEAHLMNNYGTVPVE